MNFEKILSHKKVKIFIASIIMGLCITSMLQSYADGIIKNISSKVLRLHVVANSNTFEDQDLKLRVRDGIINYLAPVLDGVTNTDKAKQIIENNIEQIKKEAEKIIKKYGYNYNVTVNTGNFEFPTKIYESTKFPKGKYDAVKIEIGNGRGNNWWCVLYPQLCFSKGNGTLSEKSENLLKESLNQEEYNLITSKSKINFKFKIVELFSS